MKQRVVYFSEASWCQWRSFLSCYIATEDIPRENTSQTPWSSTLMNVEKAYGIYILSELWHRDGNIRLQSFLIYASLRFCGTSSQERPQG
ncbi:hypothetical protein SK128_023897 [Halocaridina rubra]|uniref:Uncharacterized protein n=1 Tax=Halocaridina rubra TaxID=373956 RepID=A0AAN8X7F9_HALRR